MNYLKFNQELDEYLDSHKYSFYLFSKIKHLYYITTVIFRKVISFYAKNGNHFLPLISS